MKMTLKRVALLCGVFTALAFLEPLPRLRDGIFVLAAGCALAWWLVGRFASRLSRQQSEFETHQAQNEFRDHEAEERKQREESQRRNRAEADAVREAAKQARVNEWETIQRMFRQLSFKVHPDRSKDNGEQMRMLNDWMDSKRREYEDVWKQA